MYQIAKNNIISVRVNTILFSVIVFFSGIVSAHINSDRIENLTVEDGLSQNYIYSIFQDSRGFIWIGTKDGLNRYDGYGFRIYRNNSHDSTTLSNNNVSYITEDISGNLWVGTLGGGVNRYNHDKDNFTRFLHNENDTNSISDNFVKAIFCNTKNGVWIGSNKGHVDYIDQSGNKIIRYPFENFSLDYFGDNSINKLYEDSTGVLWIASTFGGLDRFDRDKNVFENKLESEQLDIKYRRNHTNDILQKEDGSFWVAKYSGLFNYNPVSRELSGFPIIKREADIHKLINIAPAGDGRLWLHFENSLVLFNTETGGYEFILKDNYWNFTSAFCVDHSGIVWIGTCGYGLVKINPRNLKFNTEPGSFINDFYHGIFKKLREIQSVKINNNSKGMSFPSIARDSKGYYWISTSYQGLFQFSPDLQSVKSFPTSRIGLRNRMRYIDKVFIDRQDDVWVTTVGGVDRLNREKKSFEHFRIYPGDETDKFAVNKSGYQDITAVYRDKEDIFWLGTPTLGLVRLNTETSGVSYYQFNQSNESSINNDFVLSIAEDPNYPDSILWIGTEGGGLNRLDKTSGTFEHFTTDEGLPNNVVYGIIPDDHGNLWMSTNKGISRFNPVTQTFRNYDVNDGLQSNEFNRNEYFRTEDGEMYFGGINGFNHFYPSYIKENYIAPQIVVTDFQIIKKSVSFSSENSPLEKPIWETDHIILAGSDNVITFKFAALDFSAPHKNKFAYKLEGLNSDWINNGYSTEATFTNLDPGEYVFRVKGSNSDDHWNEQGASITLTILPPFWQTWWFTLILSISVVGIIVYAIRRKIYLINREKLKQQEFSRRLIESQEKERQRVASELHDSIGQSVLLIKNKLHSGLKRSGKDDEFIYKFRDAVDIAGETLQEIRAISQNLRPQHLDHLGLTTAIEEMIDKVACSSEIEFKYSSENIDGCLSGENEINFFRIIQEAVNNIIKHSEASKAELTICRSVNSIDLNISDNGKGLNEHNSIVSKSKRTGFGMSTMHERARILGGDLKMTNRKQGGTEIALKVNL